MSNVISTGLNAQEAKSAAGTIEKIISIVLENQLQQAREAGADKAIIKAYQEDIANLKKVLSTLKTKEV